MVVFGTNGMLINDRMAKELVEIGVMGMGISIDSLDPQKHDTFRGCARVVGRRIGRHRSLQAKRACSSKCTSAPSR